jgi:ribonuclease T2
MVAPASAADQAGRFDFYVLALTWSPSYCANTHRPDPAQCDLKLPGFVVHGLWPEYERGYPQYCESATLPRRLPRSIISGFADLIPSPDAAEYEWEKHGICSGLRPENYFALLRRASERVTVPPAYIDLGTDLITRAPDIEAAFVAANPGMSDRGMTVTCDRDGVIEVRICLTTRLDFRRCAEVDRDTCRSPSVTLQAVD